MLLSEIFGVENGRLVTTDSISQDAQPKIIASGEGWDFWLIGNDVYRSRPNGDLDIYGHPSAKRWECSFDHWNRYRAVFSWAKTIDSSETDFQGIKINVENKKGSIRKGVDEDGESYKTKMFYPYGEIIGSVGADGDPIDVFIGPNKDSDQVFIVRSKMNGEYDEDKVLLGFDSLLHARDAFCAHYDQPAEHLGPIDKMTMEEFKAAIKNHKKGTRIQ